MKLLKTLAGLVPLVTGFLILAFVASCDLGTPPVTGGGGTEVEGIIVDQHGNPAAGIWVRVYPDSGIALAKRSESSESFVAIRDSARTNAYGVFKLPNLPSGTYNLVATVKRNDTTLSLFRRSIVVNGNANLGTDTLRIAGSLSLQVVLAATNIGGALCYIPGSPYIAVTGLSGICTLTALPPGIYRVSVASLGLSTGQTGEIAVLSFQVTTGGTLNLLQFIINPPPSADSLWNVQVDSIQTLIIGDAPPAFRDSVPFTRLAQASFLATWGGGNARGHNFYGETEMNTRAFVSQIFSTLLYGSNPGQEPWTGATVRVFDARGTVTHFDSTTGWKNLHRVASKFRRAAFALTFPDSTTSSTSSVKSALKITRVVVRKNGSVVLDSTRTTGFATSKHHAFMVEYLNRVGTDSLEISTFGNSGAYSGLLFKGSVVLTPGMAFAPALNMQWMGSTGVLTAPAAPVLNAPANGATVTDLGVLNWRLVSGAASYQAQISTDSVFIASSLKLNDSSLVDTTRSFTVNATAPYFWRVRARNVVGFGPWSMVRKYSGVKSPVNCALAINQTPVLVSPANEAVNVSTPALLTWDSTCSALGYRLQVATDSNFTALVYSNDSLATAPTSKSVLLSSNTIHYWRVAAKYTAGWSNWSALRKFTVGTAATLAAPTLTSPAQFATGISMLPTLAWNAVSGATRYQFQVSLTSAFTVLAYSDSITATSHTKTGAGLNTLTDYYWRVKALSGSGSSAFSEVRRFTTGATPGDTGTGAVFGAPTLVSPADSAKNLSRSSTLLTWTPVSGATAYNLQVSTSAIFSSFFVNDSAVAGSSKAVTGLAALTRYYWRVRAKNSSGVSAFSRVRSFTSANDTTAALSAPVLVSPAPFAVGVSTSPTLSWNFVSGALNYGLQVSTNSSFSTLTYSNDSIAGTSKPVSGLTNNTYYWRVRAKAGSTTSAYSETRVFTIGTVTMDTSTFSLNPPTLIAPAQFSTAISSSPTFSWNAVSGASLYGLQVSTTSTFTSLVFSNDSLALTSRVVTGLASNVDYYWRVRAKAGSTTSAYSTVFRFTTGAAPAPGPWTARTSGTAVTLYSVTPFDSLHYPATPGSDSLLMTVGAAGTLLTSVDGFNWASQTSGTTNALYAGAGGDNQRLAVGAIGTILGAPLYMVPWTQKTSATTQALYGVTWSGAEFLAVGANGMVLTSPSGSAWAVRNSGTTKSLNSVKWNGSLYVAVGSNGAILTSPSGAVWTIRDSVSTGNHYSVTWTGSSFIAVGAGGVIRRSTNGTTWTSQASGTASDLYAVAYGGGTLRAVGATGTILTSTTDGITWTAETSLTTQNLYGVSKFKSGWVAVGAGGTVLTKQ